MPYAINLMWSIKKRIDTKFDLQNNDKEIEANRMLKLN